MKKSYICILFAFVTLIASGDKEYKTIKKACADSTYCDKCLFLTTGRGIYVEACAKCCTGNKCNAGLNYTRGSKSKPNGYVCPACYRKDTAEGCDPGCNTIKCTGGQNTCVNYGGAVQFSDSTIRSESLQGCISKDGCKSGFAFLPGVKELQRKKLVCTPARKI
ncbi:phospholipase A2 inhibitor LNF1-like isoform X2 [Eleutherodactylus coqui]|uniref:phospholipase A2 inhibitor LNF1-like isoform X2 n=1 Tax=Eleutherodactylus coqui TaxID=57060 RepID=UPI0034637DA0